jgi:small conductance mechanosensitive channel
VLEQAMLELREENPAITDGPRVLGMSELLDSGVEFLLWARSSPGAQWELARQMRRKAKAALDAAGIEIPFPHRVVFNRTED